jgi:hypothetical protein
VVMALVLSTINRLLINKPDISCLPLSPGDG